MDNPAPTTEEREQFEAWVAERRRKEIVSDSAKTYRSLKDAAMAQESTACYCIGPQKGSPFCPCVMRDKYRTLGNPLKPFTAPYEVPPVPVQGGWKCPVCGKGNAPWAPTCQNLGCGIDIGKVTCEAKS